MRTRLANGTPARFAGACAIVLLAVGCLTPIGGRTPAERACDPAFSDAEGWLGGDAAFSVHLPPSGDADGTQRSLWLFGDSFVARRRGETDRQYPFVHNTVGVSTCTRDGRWTIDYAWRVDENGTPGGFFRPDPEADWVREVVRRTGDAPYYWPFAGFVHRGDAFVALLRVAPAPPSGAFALPFAIVGTDLARLTPDRSAPERWSLEIRTLTPSSEVVPASAFVVENDFVYAFAFLNRTDGRRPRALARLPLAAIDARDATLADRWSILDRDGAWQRGLDPSVAAVVLDGDATEMSVHRDAATDAWWAIESGAATPGRGEITLRRARRLEGPWSRAESLLVLPEVEDRGPGEPFCYAGKAHPQYATPDSIVVSWVCNLFAAETTEALGALEELAERTDLYRPIVVRMPRP